MIRNRKAKPKFKPLSLGDDWPWRPHKGRTVEIVIEQEPKYVRWCLERGIELDNEAYQFLEQKEEEL